MSSTVMTEQNVREFFNAKAVDWARKYQPGGPLVHRIEAFIGQLGLFVRPPSTVLDLGCGSGDLAARLDAEGYRVTACDIAEEMIVRARKSFGNSAIEWRLLEVRSEHLPFADDAFDAVVASSVFEYIENPIRTLAECHRLLSSGGFLIFTAPNPMNIVRRIEAAVRPMALLARVLPWPIRVQRYIAYLKLSRNRFPADYWNDLGKQVGFHVCTAGEANLPLRFHFFQKSC